MTIERKLELLSMFQDVMDGNENDYATGIRAIKENNADFDELCKPNTL